MDYPTPLAKWLADKSISQTHFCSMLAAEGVRVYQPRVSLWCRGLEKPTGKRLVAIKSVTGLGAEELCGEAPR